MSSIDTFVGSFGEGILRPSRYVCYIRNPYSSMQQYELAEAINMPGRSLATFQKRRWGPQYDLPYERLFPGEIELTFIMTPSTVGLHRSEFSKWMDNIISPQNNMVNSNRASYCGEIDVILQDDSGGDALVVTFYEAYPKAINPVSLSYATDNDYVRQTISFSFREFDEGSSVPGHGGGFGGLGGGGGGGLGTPFTPPAGGGFSDPQLWM